MKLIAILLIAFGVFLIVRLLLSKPQSSKPSRTKWDNSPPSNKMVACTVCQLHIPEQDAIRKGARSFCSIEHLSRWEQQQSGNV